MLLAQIKIKISSMEFSEEESKKKLDSSQFIQYFLSAPTWADCRRIIDKHPGFLTGETERLIEDASAWAPENKSTMMDERLALFHQCCEEGVEAAF